MDTEAIQALLSEAAETHHRVYRIVDGNDSDWASWYADWLLNLSELPTLLGPVRCAVSSCISSSNSIRSSPVNHATEGGRRSTPRSSSGHSQTHLRESRPPYRLLIRNAVDLNQK